jgi:adenylate kinase
MINNVKEKWIAFLGVPGCGKGTQAEFLAKENSFHVICVGDMLRENLDKSIPGGRTIGDILSQGELLPDSVVIDLVQTKLESIPNAREKNLLFDGFPRTEEQALALTEIASDYGKVIFKVINFVIADEHVKKRILGRYKCSNCGKIYNKFFLNPQVEGVCDVCNGTNFDYRTDDNEESLSKRLLEYRLKTKPLIDYYTKSDTLYNINAAKSFDEVRESVRKGLEWQF